MMPAEEENEELRQWRVNGFTGAFSGDCQQCE